MTKPIKGERNMKCEVCGGTDFTEPDANHSSYCRNCIRGHFAEKTYKKGECAIVTDHRSIDMIDKYTPGACPWCGDEETTLKRDPLNPQKWYGWVDCDFCGARGPVETSEHEALNKWRHIVACVNACVGISFPFTTITGRRALQEWLNSYWCEACGAEQTPERWCQCENDE